MPHEAADLEPCVAVIMSQDQGDGRSVDKVRRPIPAYCAPIISQCMGNSIRAIAMAVHFGASSLRHRFDRLVLRLRGRSVDTHFVTCGVCV